MENKKNLSAGQIVFNEGDPGDAMYVVIQGLVHVYRDTPGGRLVLAKIEAGQFFGEMSLIGNTPRTAAAVALTDTVLAVYKPNELEELLDSRPQVGARMIRKLVERLKETTDSLVKERTKNPASW